MEHFDLSIVGHSADLKVNPTNSKDTGIFLPPDLVSFLGDLDNLSFTIFREDCLKAITALIQSLPLYSNKGGRIVVHDDAYEELRGLFGDVESFFKGFETAQYSDFKPNETTGGRFYLYGLTKPSGFSIRKFFVSDYTKVRFNKDSTGKIELRFTTDPTKINAPSLSSVLNPGDEKTTEKISQTIYFGAPGTGKSYKIENEILSGVPDTSKIRVTFYPDYYYSDFIGGLRPKKQGKDITYEFTAGPFAEALLKSFKEPTYLIIEEINRGNPAAIFGDIFQLLDRRDDGRSRYETTNEDLYNYLVKKNSNLASELPEKKVFLPAGLHILCTMNTADQNVFVLDTAFKRRFSMEYVPIDMDVFGTDPKLAPYKAEGYPAFEGTEDLATLLGETGSSIAGPKRNWPTFAAFVNAKIDEINASETKISEDKKLGPFFADVADFNDRKKFADKVLYYLKQDVFKYEDTILTDSYEKLYEKFTEESMDIFTIFN